ncbi:L-histidine N(alpha)-methyltransferase [Thioalkalivibrio sp.]|uniref:L-histidine N(alpha)-methyltransferase n=1 Tax=Thioalkalivibrio sp. TaxID=2093813 RepID=UPI003568F2C0
MFADPSAARLTPRYSRRVVEERDAHAELLADFRAGMLESPRSLPPKYFYDARGSQLFDAICDTPEYYPTRLEAELLERHAGAIMEASGARTLFELGSGTSRKTEYLLEALAGRVAQPHYVANDVCGEILDEAGGRLLQRFEQLQVDSLCGDYAAALTHLADVSGAQADGPRLFAFLGSSLGNFEDAEAGDLLRRIRETMNPEDRLLLGLDRIKPRPVLESAYNDEAGVTAAFNLNLLAVLNTELGADFDLEGFEHRAPFVEAQSRIEMHLVSRRDQVVHVSEPEARLQIAEGEVIRTEISRKFSRDAVDRLLAVAGLEHEAEWSAPEDWYSLFLLRPGVA